MLSAPLSPIPVAQSCLPDTIERLRTESPDDYVFPDPRKGGMLIHNDMYRLHRVISQQMDIGPNLKKGQYFRIHEYRHTWATLAHAAGMDISNVAKHIGDTIETAMRRYIPITAEALGDALEAVEGTLSERHGF